MSPASDLSTSHPHGALYWELILSVTYLPYLFSLLLCSFLSLILKVTVSITPEKMGKDRQFWPLTCRFMVRMHLELQTIKMRDSDGKVREREEFALV